MIPFVYQYSLGGLVFLIGLFFAWRQNYIGLSGKPFRNLLLCLGGFFFFFLLQGYLQFAPMKTLEAVSFKGGKVPVLGNWVTYSVMIGYFVIILIIGTIWGKDSKNTKDYFFGGQRFSWWLIAFSLVATTIGSYSFVKYSKIAYQYGLASTQTYLNDWFWFPLLVFGWLPILYFSKIRSIPEYFVKRFNPLAGKVVTFLLLFYMIGYVGVNLFTMGRALQYLLGWPVFFSAVVVASISAVYVTLGGQTSVIMTDLFQGIMLMVCGFVVLYLGAEYLGGFQQLWENLPREHRMAFANFNKDTAYHSVGIFWQDAIANSAMFYFLNQGMLMRFMAARSIQSSRKSVVSMFLLLMPMAAVVVASGGWVGKALSNAGVLQIQDPGKAFFIATRFLSTPLVFGLIMASLTAALMSTIDTLITAVSAIVVNDIYKPLRPKSSEKKLLKIARITSVSVTVLGVLLVPVFMNFKSIYSAHAAFTAAITPPMVVALLLGVFWKRFTPMAGVWTMVGGTSLVILSIFYPEIIQPFAHGVPLKEVEGGFLSGLKQYKFMRALFGLSVSFSIGVLVTYLTKPKSLEELKGLVWGTTSHAMLSYKGSPGSENESEWLDAEVTPEEEHELETNDFYSITVSSSFASKHKIQVGDLLFLSHPAWWYGGLYAAHGMVSCIRAEEKEEKLFLHPEFFAKLKNKSHIRFMKLYELEK